MVFGYFKYATLDDGQFPSTYLPDPGPHSTYKYITQQYYLREPAGWELAPNTASSWTVTGAHPWFSPSPATTPDYSEDSDL